MFAVLLSAVLVAAIVAVTLGRPTSGKVYSVADVQAGLRQDPAAWNGREVLVHGWFVSIQLCVPHSRGCYRYLWYLIEPSPENGPGVPGLNAWGLYTCRASSDVEPLVLAGGPSVHWAHHDTEYAPSSDTFLRLLSHLPVVGPLVPPSALYRGLIFHIRVQAPRPCRLLPHASIAPPSPNAVLLSDPH